MTAPAAAPRHAPAPPAAMRRRTRGEPAHLRGRVLVAVLVLLLGTLALRSAWVGFSAWPALLAMGMLGLVVIWLARQAGVATPLLALLGVAVPLLLLVTVGGTQNLGVVESITGIVPILLTSAYPAQATPLLVAPGLLVAWAAGALLGFGMPARHYVGAPLAASLVLLVAADLLTAGASDPAGLISLGLVTVLLAHWSGWAVRGRVGLPPGSTLAVLVGVLALGAGFLPVGRPVQPRDLIRPPVTNVEEPNPLPLLTYWAAHPEEEILRRQGDTYPLQLVVLPDYDGVAFGSHSVYVPLGGTERPLLPPGRYQKTLRTAVSWPAASRWLPAPGTPTDITVADALVDVDTGAVITRDPPPREGVSYVVTGRIDAALRSEVAGADIAPEPRYTALPEVPPEFVGYAREVTRDAPTYLDQAVALEQAVRGGRTFDPTAPGGSSYARLYEFLFVPAQDGGRAGTSEQFATAYAVLARSVGLPTRVVVGFGAGEPSPGDPETRIVRGRDALAWPEVYFADYGWVPFNPTPDSVGVRSPERGSPARLGPAPDTRPVADPVPAPPRREPEAGGRWLIPGLLGGCLLVAGAGLAVGRRTRSRRQRSGGDLGAWRRVEDAMVLAGRGSDWSRTAPDRAADLGVRAAVDVAVAAEAAAFGPGPVASRGTTWEAAETVVRRLRDDSPTWRRAFWPISPTVWLHPADPATAMRNGAYDRR